MAHYGYARVSTIEQDLTIQSDWLLAQEVAPERIYSEKKSGKSTEGREELAKLLAVLKPGDVVHVMKLDRLSRDTRDCLNIAEQFADQKVVLHFGDIGYADMNTPAGKMVLTVIAACATMERERIAERCNEGRKRAKANGVKFGRAANETLYKRIQELYSQGVKKSAIAVELSVSRPTIDRALSALADN